MSVKNDYDRFIAEQKEVMKKELIQLLKGKNAYIQTHDFPDPDALATAFALQEYLKYYGIEATICYEGKLERASAIRMLDNFGIHWWILRIRIPM